MCSLTNVLFQRQFVGRFFPPKEQDLLFLTGFRADTPRCPFFSRGRGAVGHKPVAKPSPVLQPLSSPVAFLNIPLLPERSADLLHMWTNWKCFFPSKHHSQTEEEAGARIKLGCPQCFRPIQRENNLLPLSFLGERNSLEQMPLSSPSSQLLQGTLSCYF